MKDTSNSTSLSSTSYPYISFFISFIRSIVWSLSFFTLFQFIGSKFGIYIKSNLTILMVMQLQNYKFGSCRQHIFFVLAECRRKKIPFAPFALFLHISPTSTPRVFHVETTWKPQESDTWLFVGLKREHCMLVGLFWLTWMKTFDQHIK